MATSGGDIRFTFTGDSSGLNAELVKVDNNLKGISNATTGTANGLDRKLKRGAENAKKGIDKLNRSMSSTSVQMGGLESKAGDASAKLESVEDAAGNTDSQLSALAGAISHVSPELGEMAGMAADSAGALEGLGRMAMRNPIVSGVTAAAVAALGVAFAHVTEEIKNTEAAIERLDRRQDVHIARLERMEDLHDQIATQYRQEVEGVDAATIAYEEQREEIARISNARQRSIDEMEEDAAARIRATIMLESQTDALYRQVDAIYAAQTALEEVASTRSPFGILIGSEAEAELERFGGSSDEIFHSWTEFEERMAELQEASNARTAERNAVLAGQSDQLAELDRVLLDLRMTEQEYTLSLADEESQIRANANAREAAMAAQLVGIRRQVVGFEDQMDAMEKLGQIEEATIAAMTASQTAMNAELADLNASRVADAQSAADEMVRIAEDKAQQEAEIALELRNQQKLADIERMNQTIDTAVALSGAALEVTSMMEQHMSEASGKEARRFFRIRQAAAVTDILMTTQQAIMRALADLGPIAGTAAGIAIGATSAAQIGTVMAEKPPAFDVGGMIRGGILSKTPDQMTASVLPGEAILNRSATERLGESGVNALNRGGSPGGVVVVPAYRHFDRFIQDEYRKGGSFRRIVGKERQFPVGQRRY
jgi:uncharacterized protein YkuJ